VAAEESAPPDISVVVAAYNEERLLPRCLDALARQEGVAYEVIVVDNASTDGTARVAAERGARVLREEKPGAVNAKALGVAEARGAIVAVIDADSICRPDWLAHIAARFAADDKLVGLTGPAHYLDCAPGARALVWLWYAGWRVIGFLARRAVYAVGTNVAFRRDAYLRTGGIDRSALVGGDEVSLFSALSRVGHTRFDDGVVVETDGRRFHRGVLWFIWEVFFGQYVFGYGWYRLTGRPVAKKYPPGSTLK
jgi:glycosyltransferase involved in cell wall biosynthesis